MNFNDIFKNSFLENTVQFSIIDTILSLVLAFGLGMFIYFIYKKTFQGVMFSRSFGVSLVALTMISTLIILAVTSNVVLSLGMVGALSIVRFRTAIKDPMDLIFLFWSISTGIICGAEMYKIAIISSLIITIGLFVLELTPAGKASVLLIVNAKGISDEPEIKAVVSKYAKRNKVKSRNVSKDSLDMIWDIKTNKEQELLKELMELEGVFGASLMAHDGEITI